MPVLPAFVVSEKVKPLQKRWLR